MPFELRPAERGEIFGRFAVYGGPGDGKTYLLLAIAMHICELKGWDPFESVGVIDTEEVASPGREPRGSAEKYVNRPCNCSACHREGIRFRFKTLILNSDERDVESYMRALQILHSQGIKIAIVDGLTEAWRSLLRLVDQIKIQTNNKEDGWGTARPLHNALVASIMNYPGHVLCAVRAKPKSRHKEAEMNAGMLPDQDSSLMHNFDIAGFSQRGTLHITKTRFDPLENYTHYHSGLDMAQAIIDWCADPEAAEKRARSNLKDAVAQERERKAESRQPVPQSSGKGRDPETCKHSSQSSHKLGTICDGCGMIFDDKPPVEEQPAEAPAETKKPATEAAPKAEEPSADEQAEAEAEAKAEVEGRKLDDAPPFKEDPPAEPELTEAESLKAGILSCAEKLDDGDVKKQTLRFLELSKGDEFKMRKLLSWAEDRLSKAAAK